MGLKKRDDEKLVTILVCALFSIVMLACLFFAGHIGMMPGFLKWVMGVCIAATAYSWIVVVRNVYDPNYDKWRYWNIAFAIAVILIVMGNRAGWMEDKMFRDDVEKNKIENAAP